MSSPDEHRVRIGDLALGNGGEGAHWELRIDLARLVELLAPSNFLLLDLRPSHLMHLLQLPVFPEHRDPFDHLLIAQAQAEALVFVTAEAAARRYPVALRAA